MWDCPEPGGSPERRAAGVRVYVDRVPLRRRIPFGRGYESFAQRHHLRRNSGLADTASPAPDRVLAYHPIGFPGRPEIRRGSLVVVDDVWALVGTSTWSRRGLTFDGSIDVSFVGPAP